MRTEKYDVLILGAGRRHGRDGGDARRRPVGGDGRSRDFGGTYPNRGCTPKKMLVAAGRALHEIEPAHVHGIAVSEPKLDWAVFLDREKQMISHIPGSLGRLMAGRGVEVIRGDAVFAGPNAARVRDCMIEARLIVVATGSKLRPLPFPGAELAMKFGITASQINHAVFAFPTFSADIKHML